MTPGGDGGCWGRNPGGSFRWSGNFTKRGLRPPQARSATKCAIRRAKARFLAAGPLKGCKSHGRRSRVHGARTRTLAKITNIPIHAAHGGAHGPKTRDDARGPCGNDSPAFGACRYRSGNNYSDHKFSDGPFQ